MSGLALAPGTVFANDYRIDRPLSEGGMGAVYVAYQLSTSRPCALKVMLPSLVGNADMRARFLREARIGASLKSDFVVQVMQAGVDDATQTPWLTMELLDGEELEAYLARVGPLSPTEVVELFDQLCDALGEAHRAGIVHRDLKPENIFLTKPRRRKDRYTAKILDFGIARMLSEAQTTSAQTKHALGTPLFMAPEQAKPGVPISPATDVWALGLIAFRLLTGRYFWLSAYDQNSTPMMLMMEAFMEDAPSASTRARQHRIEGALPPGFDAWFATCLARDADRRYADATAAFHALEGVLRVGRTDMLAIAVAGPAKTELAFAPTQVAPPAMAPIHDAVVPYTRARTRSSSRIWIITGAVLATVAAVYLVVRWQLNKPIANPRIAIPAGEALIGSLDGTGAANEHPRHTVQLAAYKINKFEITVGEYAECAGAAPDLCPPLRDGGECHGLDNTWNKHPVNCVSWSEAAGYCRWLGGRLPTEEEWENAARGYDANLYPWGSAKPAKQLCWSGAGGDKGTCPVGSHRAGASPYGLEDMAGNVWEWTSTPHCGGGLGSSPPDYKTPAETTCESPRYILRGGGWTTTAEDLRSARRISDIPSYRDDAVGFRCVW